MNSTIETTSTRGLAWSWATILTTVQSNKLALFILAPSITCFLWFFVSYHTSPLRKYPGPFLAGWTNLWRLWQAIGGEYATTIKKLHEKYGPVVRLGPNLLDLDFPELTKVIYGTDPKWHKTDFPKNSSLIIDGKIKYHLFSEVDNVKHARMKRPVVRHYSIPSVLAMEPHMDKVIMDFVDYLQKRYVNPGKTCEFGDWLTYYAWDFLGIVTFSTKFGYMEKGSDFDGTLSIADQSIDYLGICGQMPWLDHVLDKNPIYHLGPPNLEKMGNIALQNTIARLKGEDKTFNPEKPDFLQYFINSMETHPDVVNETEIVSYLILNLIAGADTTATVMRALFYHSLKNQRIYQRLQAEIRANLEPGKPAPHTVARTIPYLEATVRETMRYHPPVSMALERVVPQDGLVLPSDGSVVPGGSHVGMNPYIIGRNQGVFGADADTFNPDRWLQQVGESDEQLEERMRKWKAAELTFGGGSRICIGRNLSLMEVYKVVATLIATFDIEFDDPDQQWWYSQRWFFRTKGVVCKLKPRSTGEI